MTFEILMSCMHQSDASLVYASKITGNCVMINQCDRENYAEYPTEKGTVRMFSTTQRGLTKSRNEAIRKAKADICLLADDDEIFVPGCEEAILAAYEKLPDADVVAFRVTGIPRFLGQEVLRIRFPNTMKLSSVQISFRRENLLKSGVLFDELLGAGTGNGAEEELKFLTDCERAGLKIYYVPAEIGPSHRRNPPGSAALRRCFSKIVARRHVTFSVFRPLHFMRFTMFSQKKVYTKRISHC